MNNSQIQPEVTGRTGRSGRRFRARLIVAVAIIGVLAVVAGLLSRTGNVAFESWRAIPTAIDPAIVADATSKCLGGETAATTVVIQDQRGPTAAFLFIRGGDLVMCLAGRGSSGSIDTIATSYTKSPAPTGDLALVSSMTSPAGPAYPGLRVVVGVAASTAVSVKLQRTDGVVVTASVRGGYFLAWWPTTTKASVVTSQDSTGGQLQQLQDVERFQ